MYTDTAPPLSFQYHKHSIREWMISFADPYPLHSLIHSPGLVRRCLRCEVVAVDEFELGTAAIEMAGPIDDLLISAAP